MAASNTAHGEASLLGLDEFLDPDIQKILDEADLMEASDDDDEGTERGVGSEVEYSKGSDSSSEDSDGDSEATEDEMVGKDPAADRYEDMEISSLSPIQDISLQLPAALTAKDTQPSGPSPARLQMPQSLLLPASPEDEPIGCRTRTRLPMQHISLDDLDALLGEEGDELFDEEGEHYNTFLRVMRGEADPLELYDGEDDDEDFELDWDELMRTNFDNPIDEGPSQPAAAPRRSTRIRKYVYAPKHMRPGHQERPLQSTLLLQARRLKQLIPGSKQLPLLPALLQPPPHELPQPPRLPPAQAAVAIALGGAFLPRGAPSHTAVAMGGTGMPQGAPYQAGVAMGGTPVPRAPPPVAAAGGLQAGWKPEQVAQLHRQVEQHVQLLVTTFAAAAKLPGPPPFVTSAGQLIHKLQALPPSIRSWPLVGSVVHAVTNASSMEGAVEAMAQLPACFNASLLPAEGGVSLERDWLPSEDELLARGILRFGQDTGRLRQYFLPGRLASEIPPRIRQRLTARAGDNPVKAAVAHIRGPLTALEIAHIEAGLTYYGRQAKRWELIAVQFMPYRSGTLLARLWSNRAKAKEEDSAPAHTESTPQDIAPQVHWTLLSGQPNQAQQPATAQQPPAAAMQLPPQLPHGGMLPLETAAPVPTKQPAGQSAPRQKRKYTRRKDAQPAAPAVPSQQLSPLGFPPHAGQLMPQQQSASVSHQQLDSGLQGMPLESLAPEGVAMSPQSAPHSGDASALPAWDSPGAADNAGCPNNVGGSPSRQPSLLHTLHRAAEIPRREMSTDTTNVGTRTAQQQGSPGAASAWDLPESSRAGTATAATAGISQHDPHRQQQPQRAKRDPRPAPASRYLTLTSAVQPCILSAAADVESLHASAFSAYRSTRSQRGATPSAGDTPSPTAPITRPSDISISPLSPLDGDSPELRDAATGEANTTPGMTTRSKRRKPRKPQGAGLSAEDTGTAARRPSLSRATNPLPPQAVRRQTRGRKAVAPRRKAARLAAHEELDPIDDWEPVSLLALAETASRQAEELLAADEAAAEHGADKDGDAVRDPFDEFSAHRRRALASALTASDFGGQPQRQPLAAAERELRLQAAAAEARLDKELRGRPAVVLAAMGRAPERLPLVEDRLRAGLADLPGHTAPSRPVRGRSAGAQSQSTSHPGQAGAPSTSGEQPSGEHQIGGALPRGDSVHGPTDFASHFAAQRKSAAGSAQQPTEQPAEAATESSHPTHLAPSQTSAGVSDRVADTAFEGTSINGAPAGGGEAGAHSESAAAAEQPGSGREDGAAARKAPEKMSDADFIIDGILTHWTQNEDRDIMYTAWQQGGTLDEADCSRIAALPLDPALAWPLPRTPLQIRARLDWLLERFQKQTG